MAARTRFFRARSSTLSPSRKSIARLALPSRPALNSLSGSGRLAPWAKVSFTFPLWALATAIIPSRDHTGLPIHFHSSMISRSAARMLLRTLAKVLPRQSVSSAISRSICSDGFIGSPRFEFGRWTEKPAARQWLQRRPYSSSNSSSSSTLLLVPMRRDLACRRAIPSRTARARRRDCAAPARAATSSPDTAAGSQIRRRRGAAHQIDVDVIVVIDVGARRQHGGELLAGGGLHVVQKALLFRHAPSSRP